VENATVRHIEILAGGDAAGLVRVRHPLHVESEIGASAEAT
jgi:hypothetical protein